MLKIFVVDETAESRHQLAQTISNHLTTAHREGVLLPQLSVVPLAIEELKFHGSPNLVVVGPGLVDAELSHLALVRRILPSVPLLVRLDAGRERLALIEQLARLGIDDVWGDSQSAHDFLRKLILMSSKVQREKRGSLVLVDSGKGGLGVTSITAGLGEALAVAGKKVVVVDLDFESQDLSRFLGVRPYVNENLQLMLDQKRPVTKEFVEQSVSPVWSESDNLWCLPPAIDGEALIAPNSAHSRTMLSIFEMLDEMFDVILVDSAGTRGSLLRTLCRVADQCLMLVSADPASLYVSVERLQRARSAIHPEAGLFVIENHTSSGLKLPEALREEFFEAAKLDIGEVFLGALPYHGAGGRWPGSGGTLYSISSARVARLFEAVCAQIGLIPEVSKRMAGFSLQGLVSTGRSLLSRSEPPARLSTIQAKAGLMHTAMQALPSPTAEQADSRVDSPAAFSNSIPSRVAENMFSAPVFEEDQAGATEKRTNAAA